MPLTTDLTKHRALMSAGLSPQDAALLASDTVRSSFIAKSGNVAVANNILPPGHAIMMDGSISYIRARVGTAPTTQAINIRINLNGSQVALLSIAAAATSGLASITTPIPVTAGDVITVDITQIGSGTVGADLAIDFAG